MGVDPTQADALFISHGHVDHFGGLLGLQQADASKFKPGLTLYAGGNDTFCHRVVVGDDKVVHESGLLDRKAVEAAGGVKIAVVTQPTIVAGHAITSGQIPRKSSFEHTPLSWNLQSTPGDACSSMHFAATRLETPNGTLIHDDMLGEHVLVYNVKNRGLVVLMSCGHAGAINTLQQVRAVTGIDTLHAVVGGMHLAPAPDALIEQTVNGLAEFKHRLHRADALHGLPRRDRDECKVPWEIDSAVGRDEAHIRSCLTHLAEPPGRELPDLSYSCIIAAMPRLAGPSRRDQNEVWVPAYSARSNEVKRLRNVGVL